MPADDGKKFFSSHSTAELSYDTPVAFDGHSEWLGPNQTHAGELWDNLDVSPLVIAVTDKWAVQRNLDVSESRFPWDDEKGLYYLKAFHHLHCLVSVDALVN